MNGDQSEQPSRHEVVLVSPLPPPLGGLTVWTTEYLESARSHGLSVKLINTSPGGDRVEAASRVRFARVAQMMATLRDLWGALPAAEITHISTTWYWSLVRDGLLAWMSSARRIPVVMQIHAATNVVDSVRALSGWRLRVVRMWLRPVDVLVVLSHDLHGAMTHAFPNQRIVLTPNWVNTDRFVPATAELQERLPARGTSSELLPTGSSSAVRLVFVGRLMKEKGFVELANAVLQTPSTTLLCVGDKPEGLTSDESSMIDALVAELVATNRFTWMKSVPRENIAATLRSADVFVLPSWNEGLPISLLEAMATGLACVVTPVGGMRDLMDQAVAAPFALSVPVADSASLGAALTKLVGDADLRRTLSANGRALAESTFSATVVMGQLQEIYDSL